MIALGIMLGYMALLIVLGVVTQRVLKLTAGDYFLASRGIGPFMLLMSLFGTTMTAFALIGSTGETFERGIGVYGLMASWSGIVHSACFFLIGARVWWYGKRYGYLTQIQFFRERFGSDLLGLLLFFLVSGFVLIYILMGVIGAGRVLNVLTQEAFAMEDHVTSVPFAGTADQVKIPEEWRRRVRIESGQLIVQGALASHRRGQLMGWSDSPAWKEAVTELFKRVPNGGLPYGVGTAIVCVVVLFYVFTGGMRATAWANTLQTLFFMIAGVLTFVVIARGMGGLTGATERVLSDGFALKRVVREGMIGRLEFTTYCFIPLSVAMFPHLFQHWLTARRADTFRLPVVAHPVCIMITWLPCVLIGMWAAAVLPETTPRNAVLPAMIFRFATPWVAGLLGAGILAAIMSSMDSQFLCLSSMFTNDVVGHYIRHDVIGEKTRVYLGRLFVALLVFAAYLIGLWAPAPVFPLGVWCFSGFAALFPIAFAAVYWRRSNKYGALASLLTVAAMWIWWLDDALTAAREGHAFLIAGVMPVTFMLLASTVVLVVVSLITPPPPQAIVDKFFGFASPMRNEQQSASRAAGPS